MKKSIIFLFVSALLLSCAAGQTASEKRAVTQQLQSQIEDSVEQRTFKITVNYVNPLRMPPQHLMTDYSVALRGDTVESWLPYFGVAQRADIADNSSSPLIFKGKVDGLRVGKGRRGAHDISFATRRNSEYLEYRLLIFPNGSASVDVTSSDRDAISFDGQMDVNVAPTAQHKQ